MKQKQKAVAALCSALVLLKAFRVITSSRLGILKSVYCLRTLQYPAVSFKTSASASSRLQPTALLQFKMRGHSLSHATRHFLCDATTVKPREGFRVTVKQAAKCCCYKNNYFMCSTEDIKNTTAVHV
jgi:hypothetical protein